MVAYYVAKEGLDTEILRISRYVELPSITQRQQHSVL